MPPRFSTDRSWYADPIRPHSFWRLRYHLVCLALAGFVALGGHGGLLVGAVGAQEDSAAIGHAEVIAQAVVDLPDGSLAWGVSSVDAGAGQRATRIAGAGAPGFVLGLDGAAVLRDSAGDRTRLTGGEAVAVRPDDVLSVQAAGDQPASLALLTLDRADRGAGEAFVSPGASRDIDLVRDILAEDESTQIGAGDAPTFVLVTGGSIAIAADGADAQPLQAGDTALLTGSFRVTGAATGASSFVAALIGQDVDGAATAGAGSPPGGNPVNSPRPTASAQPTSPSETDDPTPTPTEVPPTPTPPGSGPNDDPDKDNLTNSEEAIAGTDPLNPDTDGDSLYDGDEVKFIGTNPNFADSDSDGLEDAREVNDFHSNPLNPDTDGDGANDYLEVTQNTQLGKPDTDEDGLTDGQEINIYHTNPLSPDTDGDALGDALELVAIGTSPNKADTDGDGLSDSDEVNIYLTDPFRADTDGDGYNDGTEIASGTDPFVPGSHP